MTGAWFFLRFLFNYTHVVLKEVFVASLWYSPLGTARIIAELLRFGCVKNKDVLSLHIVFIVANMLEGATFFFLQAYVMLNSGGALSHLF